MSKDDIKAPSRRRFLGTAGLAGAAVGLPANAANAAMSGTAGATLPFYGIRQAGITTPMQDSLYFAAFDLKTDQRGDVVTLLQRWTDASARMSAGLAAEPGAQNDEQPGLDSGETVGLTASRLSITFGFGPDMFILNGKDRYGLAAKRPAALVDLPRFNGDQLVEEQSGGALCVQACADDPQVAFHAVRQLSRLSYGVATLKWVQSGFATASKTKGTPRNLMGFKDGTMNPTGNEMDEVVWAGTEGPAWMDNGSYMVARRIRIALEHWDRMKVMFQEQTFGRHKASGAPLGGKHEFDTPDFNATDSDGNYIIPENAHARLGAAATNGGAQILRRSYAYNDGANFTAERWPPWTQGIEFDSGLFFQAYQKDPRTGFIRIFDKMSKFDALNQFTTHVGSAIFACPPGAKKGSYIGAPLFEAA
jgi:deferrochelatase/peroxidase EfeB